jgi:phosphopantothenoylcysteine decarboxylase / phosphopantothenate---cysteine ligase
MGYAMAQTMAQAGGQVLLISGPTALECPRLVNRLEVETAEEMLEAVRENLPCDIFVGVAAVSDYKPQSTSSLKMKSTSEKLSIHLVKNPDILTIVAQSIPKPFIILNSAVASYCEDLLH